MTPIIFHPPPREIQFTELAISAFSMTTAFSVWEGLLYLRVKVLLSTQNPKPGAACWEISLNLRHRVLLQEKKEKKKEREREKEMGRNKDFLRKQNMRYRKKKSRDKGEEARRKGALGEY